MDKVINIEEALKRIEELEKENAKLREELEYYRNRKLSGRQKHNAKWMAIYNDFVVGYESGMTMVEIAKRNNVSERTIYRYKASGIDYARKEDFKWISVIRLPDFVTREDFDWAVRKATAKKKQDFSKAEFFSYEEGLCVQCMHIGAYDDEPVTVDAMHRFMEEQGYALDITDRRMHHEIYLSDARKVAPEKLKTVIRHPIKRA